MEQQPSVMISTDSDGIAQVQLVSPAVKKKMKFDVQVVSHKNPKLRDNIEGFVIK